MDRHFGYRTPIEGPYIVGSPAHPGAAISGGAGYIAAGIIADDIGLKPSWKRADLRAQLGLVRYTERRGGPGGTLCDRNDRGSRRDANRQTRRAPRGFRTRGLFRHRLECTGASGSASAWRLA
jgi:hypothetical protein